MSEPSLEDVLNGEVTDEVTTGEESETPSQPEDTEEEQETTAEESEESEAEEPKEEPKDEPGTVPIAALLDEREKRQRAERRAEELEQSREPEKAIDPIDDPDGFREQQAAQFAQQRAQDAFEILSSVNPKLQEAWDWAQEETQRNPVLLGKIAEHQGSPVSVYKAVLEAYEQHERFSQMEDVGAMEARLREEIEAKVRAEFEAEKSAGESKAKATDNATSKPSVASIPTSSSSATEGELSLEDVLGGDALSRPR